MLLSMVVSALTAFPPFLIVPSRARRTDSETSAAASAATTPQAAVLCASTGAVYPLSLDLCAALDEFSGNYLKDFVDSC